MQFVKNGPDVPEILLQAHEEGRVVFFCGAGISYPAGLPDFKGLVDDIYRKVNAWREPNEEETYTRGQYDVTLGLLERRFPMQRKAIRRAVKDILQPNFDLENALDTHKALLLLGYSRKGKLRLITTNFDRIFENVAKQDSHKINSFIAPALPIPKSSCWNGLVYLHGLLPEQEDDDALNQLILTSGDFGLAYLTERWAARFVSELFRNYLVCFVGYSIDDPVLRYMMDAISADRMQGESTLPVYAFGSYDSGQEKKKLDYWKAKSVEPILYEVPKGTNDHSKLHLTLKKWAEIYRDGILGKESIVVKYARTRPFESTQQDNFREQMLWALSDESGLPAKRFAELDPPPPLEWLEYFSENRYKHHDLKLFGVQSSSNMNEELNFSLINRPASYTHTPKMSLTSFKYMQDTHWDEVMYYLARWLLRHLNDPALILWLVEHGDQLHNSLLQMIDRELDRIARMERKNKDEDMAQTKATNEIVQPLMRVLWRLLLSGRVKSSRNDDLYQWENRLKRDGFTVTLRLELRELLTPKVILKKPFRWPGDNENANASEHLRQIVDCELVLTANNVQASLHDLAKIDEWHDALPMLLYDFQQLLRDALDLLAEIGEADARYDRSYSALPSISTHWQNKYSSDWGVLIELLRDAWISVREHDSTRGKQIAQEWFSLPYPTFKRLALFAASHDDCIAGTQWVDWLTVDDAWWLWSPCTQRETLRLLVKQGAFLPLEDKEKLEGLILAGPPRKMYINDIEQAEWSYLVDRDIWLRLVKLQEGENQLGPSAIRKFADLSKTYPKWKLSEEERDEFPRWGSGTGDPGFENERASVIVPRKREESINWLAQTRPDQYPFHADKWREFSRKYPAKAGWALRKLALMQNWLSGFWNQTLYALNEKKFTKRLWKFFIPFICEKMPDDSLLNVAGSVTAWLRTMSKLIEDDEKEIFFKLCHRVLGLQYQGEVNNDHSLSQAINHPIGHITEALLNLWFQRKPSDNDKLPEDIEIFFTQLCDTKVEWLRYGRVLLASHLIELFRVDRPWTEEYLLPLFDWTTDPLEAKAVWEGFLRYSYLYEPLFIAFKTQFFNTVHHYEELTSEAKHHFAALLTYAALENIGDYTVPDFQDAVEKLPQEGLQDILETLTQALESAGEQREEYWKNRILPFWKNIWYKHRDRMSPEIARLLAHLSIAAHGEFSSAVSVFQDWFLKIDYFSGAVSQLLETGLARDFPEDSLKFLDAIIGAQSFVPPELKECLDTISQFAPQLENDPRYRQLNHYVKLKI